MPPGARGGPPRPEPDAWVSVAEIRDYAQINAHLVQVLDRGAKAVRLTGVSGQRLLAYGLRGAWNAVIEVDGLAGPELAAEMNAPNLRVVALQAAADGAGRGLITGRVLILGPASDGLGHNMLGGSILALKGAGPRAGLRQHGGLLAISGPVGRLAADRQGGGTFWALGGPAGDQPARGRRGGRLLAEGFETPSQPDRHALEAAILDLEPWLPDLAALPGWPLPGS